MMEQLTSVGLEKRTYERLVWLLVGVGCLGLLVGIGIDERFAGTVTYLVAVWIGMAIAFGAPYVSEVKLYDERDEALHNRASGLTIGIACILTVSIVPALYVLNAGGYVEITTTLWGVIYAVSALALLYGACYLFVVRRP